MAEASVRFRLLHDGAPPAHDTGEAYLFGLQTTDGEILGGEPRPGGGLTFEGELRVRDGGASPNFLGPLASGPAPDRFVYLAWKPKDRPGYINRVKARLGAITWAQVRLAQAPGKALVADMSGRLPHDTRPLLWQVG